MLYHIDTRMCFGGCYAVNRFQRFTLLVSAYAQRMQDAFDAAQPPPPVARRWSARRSSLGSSHASPRYLHPYVDDLTGCALNDRVAPPAGLPHVTLASGTADGVAAAPDSRVAVHCGLVIAAARRFHCVEATAKTQCGDPVVALGIEVAVRSAVLRCPAGKRETLIATIGEQLASLDAGADVDRPAATRLTGRLLNLSQVLPGIGPLLFAGYQLANASWTVRGKTVRPASLRLRRGGARECEWRALLQSSRSALEANVGTALAPRLRFRERHEPGVLTIASDASGEDGFGGWGTSPDAPGVVWLVSEPWGSLRPALAAAAKGSKAVGVPALSMPAAETAAQRAVAAAICQHLPPLNLTPL